MKTTIYELLGMIKDNKAPKKIMYDGKIYEYQGDDYLYKDEGKHEHWLFSESYTEKQMWLDEFLIDEVEILETTITYNQDNYYQYQPYTGEVEIKCNSPKNILESDKIEKIDIYDSYTSHNNLHTYINTYDKDGKIKRFVISAPQREIIMKINKIIDRVNE